MEEGQEALGRRTVGAPSRTAPGREVACRAGEQRRDPCLQGTGTDRWVGGTWVQDTSWGTFLMFDFIYF